MSKSILVGVEKKKRKSMKEKKHVEAIVLVVNFAGADDRDSRWGDISIVPMSALEDTPTSYLRTLIERTKRANLSSDAAWAVYIDTTNTFPTAEDTRVVVAQQPDEFTNAKVEDAIGWEIADLQGYCAMAARIVGKIVYHTEM